MVVGENITGRIMGVIRHHFREHKFVFTVLSGEIDDENLMAHVIDLNKETVEVPDFIELADCRGISNLDTLTVRGTTNAARSEKNRPSSMLALLVPDSNLILGLTRAYQTFSEDCRKAVEIFRDVDEALAWLAEDENELLSLADFVKNA